MRKSLKKKLATPIILLILVLYAFVVTQLYMALHIFMPSWLEIAFFAIFGIGWAVPAGLAIMWIEKDSYNEEDEEDEELLLDDSSRTHSAEKNDTPNA